MLQTETADVDPRYPVGRFDHAAPDVPHEARGALIDSLAALPEHLRAAVAGLDEAGLETRYREGGWTIRQVVHHILDSHVNAYVRTRLALTEHEPEVRPYDEAAWAELPDAKGLPVEPSLAAIEGIHARWVELLRSLGPADFDRRIRHPEWTAPRTLGFLLRLYEWHGRHHLAHISAARR